MADFAAQSGETGYFDSGASVQGPADARLRELELLRCRALLEGDVAALRTLLHRRYLHVHSNGRIQTRDELLADVADAPPRTVRRGELTVHVAGSAGIMCGAIDTTVHPVGEAPGRRMVGVATQVWLSVDGAWSLASFHVTLTEPIATVSCAGNA